MVGFGDLRQTKVMTVVTVIIIGGLGLLSYGVKITVTFVVIIIILLTLLHLSNIREIIFIVALHKPPQTSCFSSS